MQFCATLLSFFFRYPIEQFHSETFGNLYLDAVAKLALSNMQNTIPALDWHFGPFAFRLKHLELWTKYDGNM